MSEEDEGEKEHEASQKRLDDARERGEIVRSADLNAAAGYAGLLLAIVAVGAASLKRIADAATALLGNPDQFAPSFTHHGQGGPIGGLLVSVAIATLPFLLGPALVVLLTLIAQRAIIFTPDKLMPKLSRISPLSGAKNKFGRNGLFEFVKSLAKLIIVAAILTTFLTGRMPEILGTLTLSPAMTTVFLLNLVTRFLFLVLLISAAMGVLDYLWQRAEHLRKNRMSRKDLVDEMKDSEGDPQMKHKRRQRGYEIATNRMLADVAKTDVVIVNPTHYAVALKWARSDRRAPVCLAKGTDEIAARIRAAASEAGIPIHQDPPTARALYAEVEIGKEIMPEHYKAVAAAIRFSEAMRKKAKGRGQ